MKIVYNPTDGAPIKDFNFKGSFIETHYHDGYMTRDGKENGLKQYEDAIADALVATFGFLEIIDEETAKRILGRAADPEFPCDFPGCDFVATKNIALLGHKRSHEKELAKKLAVKTAEKPVIDPKKIPVATKTEPTSVFDDNNPDVEVDIPNGTDKDGVEWSGAGVKVENKSTQQFGATRTIGKGHFKG